MNKNLLISLVVILVLLGGLAYWQYNLKPAMNNNENTNVDNVNTNEIDTSNWVSFTDRALGISYKYPPECQIDRQGHLTEQYLADISAGITCDTFTVYYNTLLPIEGYEDYFEPLKNNKNFTLKEIINAVYELNLNNDNINKPKDRLMTLLEEINLNGLEAYQFTMGWGYSQVTYKDNNWVSIGEYALHSPTRYTYIANSTGTKLLEIRNISKENELADEVLNTFEFIN